MRIVELERDFMYFEAYRAYANLWQLYPRIWDKEKWASERFDSLPTNRGDHKIVLFCTDSGKDGLTECLQRLRDFKRTVKAENFPYSIWVENAVRADDYCCIVSRFKEKADAQRALREFKKKIGGQCTYIYDQTSTEYRLN